VASRDRASANDRGERAQALCDRAESGTPIKPIQVARQKETDMSDGSADEGKGRLKVAAGELTDDDSLKNEGKVDKASGKTKNAVGGAADKVKDALRKD